LIENMVIVFTSDHGDMIAHRGMVQKRYFYERCTRVPPLFSLIGRWQRGKKIATPISLIDLLPAFAELIHAPTPDGLPGISLLPSI
jgi:arylsulfatase A-like enzyme